MRMGLVDDHVLLRDALGPAPGPVAELTPALTWMSDADKRCTYVNAAWLAFTGRTLEAVLTDGWRESIHPDDLPRCLEILDAAFERLVAAVKSKRHARVADADLTLHKTIVEITGHQRLIDQYRLLEQQVRHYIVCSNALIMDLNQIVSEHEPIVQAIIAGNAEAAETLARDHNAPEVERAAAAMAQEQADAAVQAPSPKQKMKSSARQSKAA